jgi:molybdate transport system substrate-binding protein
MARQFIAAVTLAAGISVLSSGLTSDAQAAEIRVLSSAVMKPVLSLLVSDFEQATEHKLVISYAPAGAVKARIEAGETADVIIVQRPAGNELVREGRINAGGMVTLARSGLAAAVRHGAAQPDIGTIDDFRRALLDAKSISYPDPAEGHAVGILFRKIVDRLDIADQIRVKTKLQKRPFSESPPQDQADLAIAQPTEILLTPSFNLVGMIPEELQDYDQFSWTAAITTNSKAKDAAATLIRFLASAKAALVMKRRGMEPGAL